MTCNRSPTSHPLRGLAAPGSAWLGVPLAEVSFDPDGIDEGALFHIADQLGAQLTAEVA